MQEVSAMVHADASMRAAARTGIALGMQRR
jgi:hypothetical protein